MGRCSLDKAADASSWEPPSCNISSENASNMVSASRKAHPAAERSSQSNAEVLSEWSCLKSEIDSLKNENCRLKTSLHKSESLRREMWLKLNMRDQKMTS